MTLDELIASDPANAGRDARAQLQWLEQKVAIPGLVASGKLIVISAMFDLEAGWWAALDDATVVPGTGITRRAIARAALRILDCSDGLDLADPDIAALLDAALAASPPLITSVARTALEAAGADAGPRWRLASDVATLPELRRRYFNDDGTTRK